MVSFNLRQQAPLIVTIILFLVALYLMLLAQVFADTQSISITDPGKRLPDIIQDNIPFWSYETINDILLGGAIVATLVRFLFHPLRLVIIRRFLFIQTFLFLLRSISMILTALPQPDDNCNSTIGGVSVFLEPFFIIATVHRTCGDIMFSGHAAMITLCAVIWTTYSRAEEWLLCTTAAMRNAASRTTLFSANQDTMGDPHGCTATTFIVWTLATGAYFTIIITHFHYSVDVFIGVLVAFLTAQYYHYFLKTLSERTDVLSAAISWLEDYDDLEAVEGDGSLDPPIQQQGGMSVALLKDGQRTSSRNESRLPSPKVSAIAARPIKPISARSPIMRNKDIPDDPMAPALLSTRKTLLHTPEPSLTQPGRSSLSSQQRRQQLQAALGRNNNNAEAIPMEGQMGELVVHVHDDADMEEEMDMRAADNDDEEEKKQYQQNIL